MPASTGTATPRHLYQIPGKCPEQSAKGMRNAFSIPSSNNQVGLHTYSAAAFHTCCLCLLPMVAKHILCFPRQSSAPLIHTDWQCLESPAMARHWPTAQLPSSSDYRRLLGSLGRLFCVRVCVCVSLPSYHHPLPRLPSRAGRRSLLFLSYASIFS